MAESQSPNNWEPPIWHPDHGDAITELQHLRTLAVAILSAIPQSKVELETPEPGLMNLRVTVPDGPPAEVYSLKDDVGRRYAVFLSPGAPSERELYTHSIEETIRCLRS